MRPEVTGCTHSVCDQISNSHAERFTSSIPFAEQLVQQHAYPSKVDKLCHDEEVVVIFYYKPHQEQGLRSGRNEVRRVPSVLSHSIQPVKCNQPIQAKLDLTSKPTTLPSNPFSFWLRRLNHLEAVKRGSLDLLTSLSSRGIANWLYEVVGP